MNTNEPHPALDTEPEEISHLTLVLPEHLSKEETLAGLAKAIGEVRTTLARRARRAQQLLEEFALEGDQLNQARHRGRMEAVTEAVDFIDEEITAAFDLFDQVEAQSPSPHDHADEQAGPPSADGTEPEETSRQ
jgi:hypothetical protein